MLVTISCKSKAASSIISQWEDVLKRYTMLKDNSRCQVNITVLTLIPHRVVIISIKIHKGNSLNPELFPDKPTPTLESSSKMPGMNLLAIVRHAAGSRSVHIPVAAFQAGR